MRKKEEVEVPGFSLFDTQAITAYKGSSPGTGIKVVLSAGHPRFSGNL